MIWSLFHLRKRPSKPGTPSAERMEDHPHDETLRSRSATIGHREPPSPGDAWQQNPSDCGLFQAAAGKPTDKIGSSGSIHERSMPSALACPYRSPGALPVLGKHQFRGNVHMTRATADLATVMLEDSARLQENDCAI